jgi:hypothetical protein
VASVLRLAIREKIFYGNPECSRYENIKLQEFAVFSWGGVGIYDSGDRKMLSDLSQVSIKLKHGFNVRARRTST